MATTFYGLTKGAMVVYVGRNCRRGGGKPVVQIGSVAWRTEDERALTGVMVGFKPEAQISGERAKLIADQLFAARAPHADNSAIYDKIIEQAAA